MNVLKKTAGFAFFALILEAIWMLLRVDVLEDLNLFADIRYWAWFVGAVVLHALLTTVAVRIRRPVVRNGWVFGILSLTLVIGLVVPRLIGGDGLAVGIFQFLNGYWVLAVAVWWFSLRIVVRWLAYGQAKPPVMRHLPGEKY